MSSTDLGTTVAAPLVVKTFPVSPAHVLRNTFYSFQSAANLDNAGVVGQFLLPDSSLIDRHEAVFLQCKLSRERTCSCRCLLRHDLMPPMVLPSTPKQK